MPDARPDANDIPLGLVAALLGLPVLLGVAWYVWFQEEHGDDPEIALAGNAERLRPARITREGTPVPPALGPIRPPANGCVHRVALPGLKAASNLALFQDLGLLWSSPVRLDAPGATLTPHSNGSTCDNGYTHGPDGLVLRLAEGSSLEGLSATWEQEPSRVVDVKGAAAREIAWVLPGTTTRVQFDLPWRDGAAFDVGAHVRVIASASTAAPATLSAGGVSLEVPAEVANAVFVLEGVRADGPWELRLTTPPDGPLLLLHDLGLGAPPPPPAPTGDVSAVAMGKSARPVEDGARLDKRVVIAAAATAPGAGCEATLDVGPWSVVSEKALYDRLGLQFASPLTLRESGVPLIAHSRGEACDGGFVHAPSGLSLRSPTGSVAGNTYEIAWPERPAVEISVKGGDAATMWWVPPGATLTVPLAATAGPVEVQIAAFAPGGEAGKLPSVTTPAGAAGPWGPRGAVHVATVAGVADAAFPLTVVAADDTAVLVRAIQAGGAAASVLDAPLSGPGAAPSAPTGGSGGWASALLGRGADADAAPDNPETPAPDAILPAPRTDAAPIALFRLDRLGRLGEKPEPLGVLHPPDAVVDSRVGTLSGGRSGVFLEARSRSATRLCTGPVPATGPVEVVATLQVSGLQPGDAPWKTLLVEDRWRDGTGAELRGADGRPATAPHVIDGNVPWTTAGFAFAGAPVAADVSVCFRFALALGRLELSALEVRPAR